MSQNIRVLLTFCIRFLIRLRSILKPREPILYVKYIKSVEGSYQYVDANNAHMILMGKFLFDDQVCSSIDTLRNWTLYDSSNQYESYVIRIKKSKGIIMLSELCPLQDNYLAFRIEERRFILLLDRWQKVYKQKPKEIMIVNKGGIMTIEAEYERMGKEHI